MPKKKKSQSPDSRQPAGAPLRSSSGPSYLMPVIALAFACSLGLYLGAGNDREASASDHNPASAQPNSPPKAMQMLAIGQSALDAPTIPLNNMSSKEWAAMSNQWLLLDEQGLTTGFDDVHEGGSVYQLPRTHPNALHWIWPTGRIGDRRVVKGIDQPGAHPIELETLSTSPRVFLVHNFMSEEEVLRGGADSSHG